MYAGTGASCTFDLVGRAPSACPGIRTALLCGGTRLPIMGAKLSLGFATPFTPSLRVVLLHARQVKSTAGQLRFGFPASSSARSWHAVLGANVRVVDGRWMG
jgi:hypothetical protein